MGRNFSEYITKLVTITYRWKFKNTSYVTATSLAKDHVVLLKGMEPKLPRVSILLMDFYYKIALEVSNFKMTCFSWPSFVVQLMIAENLIHVGLSYVWLFQRLWFRMKLVDRYIFCRTGLIWRDIQKRIGTAYACLLL